MSRYRDPQLQVGKNILVQFETSSLAFHRQKGLICYPDKMFKRRLAGEGFKANSKNKNIRFLNCSSSANTRLTHEARHLKFLMRFIKVM